MTLISQSLLAVSVLSWLLKGTVTLKLCYCLLPFFSLFNIMIVNEAVRLKNVP